MDGWMDGWMDIDILGAVHFVPTIDLTLFSPSRFTPNLYIMIVRLLAHHECGTNI